MRLNFKIKNSDGLIPVIIQEEKTGDVLMLGYMNQKAIEKTQQGGYVCFWSRKRKKLWIKGEKSGNKLKVKKIFKDCDNDALLIQVELIGATVCHQGRKSCFTTFITNRSDRLHRL